MTTEQKLKELIMKNYKSLRDFSLKADIPCSTVDTILKRGVMNASIGNILKICSALNISADELANGKIVPVEKKSERIDIEEALHNYQINDSITLELDGDSLSLEEFMLYRDALEVTFGIIRKRRRETERLLRMDEKMRIVIENLEKEERKKVNKNDSSLLPSFNS